MIDRQQIRDEEIALTFLKHEQHSMCYQKTADYVDHGQNDCDHPKEAANPGFLVAGCNDCADNRDSADGIRATHERGVKRGWYLCDDFETYKNG